MSEAATRRPLLRTPSSWPARCRGPAGSSRLTLAVSEHYTITEDSDAGWQVQRAAYFYAIGLHDTGELLTYHWHPRGKSPVVDPHLHVRANIQLGERWLGKVHLPTGPIELEDCRWRSTSSQ